MSVDAIRLSPFVTLGMPGATAAGRKRYEAQSLSAAGACELGEE